MTFTAADELAHARSFLFVPGDRSDRFEKAVQAGADVAILDLEDAVDESREAEARADVRGWLAGSGAAVVRINAVPTSFYRADCESLAGSLGLSGVVLAKTESAAEVADTVRALGVPVIPLIESATGLRRVDEIASAFGVVRIAFGSIDFSADIEAAETRESMLLARSTLVLASRTAGLAAPVEGVTTSIDDLTEVIDDARYARMLGFGAKLCIHPTQVRPVNDTFQPTQQEIEWASQVLATSTTGAVRANGQMVDKAVLARARRLLQRGRPY